MKFERFIEPVEIGAGAFGTVYQTFDPHQGRHVALKECAVGRSSAAHEHIHAMRREYLQLKELSHPNIISVYDFIVDNDGYVAIVMELAANGSLSDLLSTMRFRLHEGVVRRYFHDALKGLAFLHDRGVIHCDLKPGNLVLCGSTLKLCDFGLSKQCLPNATGCISANLTGTPRYMSPELYCEEKPKYSVASDIWALGCTILELATGKLPWIDQVPNCESPFPVIFFLNKYYCSKDSYNARAFIPSHLSNPLQDILAECLSIYPERRPTAPLLLKREYFSSESLEIDSWEPMKTYSSALASRHTPSRQQSMISVSSFSSSNSPVGLPISAYSRSSSTTMEKTVMSTRREASTRRVVAGPSKTPEESTVLRSKQTTLSITKRKAPESSIRHDEIATAAEEGTPTLQPLAREAQPVWIFVNGRSKAPYAAELQSTIEEAFQKKEKSIVITTSRLLDKAVQQYEIDFEKMRQRNMTTGYLRKVERLA